MWCGEYWTLHQTNITFGICPAHALQEAGQGGRKSLQSKRNITAIWVSLTLLLVHFRFISASKSELDTLFPKIINFFLGRSQESIDLMTLFQVPLSKSLLSAIETFRCAWCWVGWVLSSAMPTWCHFTFRYLLISTAMLYTNNYYEQLLQRPTRSINLVKIYIQRSNLGVLWMKTKIYENSLAQVYHYQ